MLTEKHKTVWAILQSLEDGQRILGPELMRRIQEEDKRKFFEIIEDLRKNLFFVGSSKSKGESGYFEVRDERDLSKLLHTMRKPAISQLRLADEIEREWYRRKEELLMEGV